MLRKYAHPRFLPILLFGFLSALPIPLTGSVLTAWLAEVHVAKALIGLLALFECPFALKPLFWPLINRVSIPLLTSLLGRRRSWALLSFLGAACGLAISALITPEEHLLLFYTCIALTSAFSGCIYLIGVAYEIESIPPDQYAGGSACVIFGYRLGLVTAGAGALFLAHYYTWTLAYLIICAGMVVGTLILLLAAEPAYTQPKPILPSKLREASWWQKFSGLVVEDVLQPALEIFKQRRWYFILLFLLFYRAGDNLVENMITPFYIELGFTKIQIAYVAKIYGIGATILGSFVGAAVVTAIGLERSLVVLGGVHACRFLLCLSLLWIGPDLPLFMTAEIFNHFSSGMIMTAFVTALWKLTTPGKAAPQYAILWSALSLKTKLLAFLGGLIAQFFSWEFFFYSTFSIAMVGACLPLYISLSRPVLIKK